MYAHIYGSKAKGFSIYLTIDASLVGVDVAWHTATKAEAKAYAKARGAVPYNY